jgi:anaerobic ribonucleoside-triphosphate reductase
MSEYYKRLRFTSCAHVYGDGKTLYSIEEAVKNGWWEYLSIHYPTLDIIEKYKDKIYWNYIIERVEINDEFFSKYKEYLLPQAFYLIHSNNEGVNLSDEILEILRKQHKINISILPKRTNPIIMIR